MTGPNGVVPVAGADGMADDDGAVRPTKADRAPAPRRRGLADLQASFVTQLTPEQRLFVTERHLATLTTLRANGTPHVVPVGFTWDQDAGILRISTQRTSVKVTNVARWLAKGELARAAVCQVEGGRWITFEGAMTIEDSPEQVAEAVRRYAVRYRQPEENPERVVLVLTVDKVMRSTYMAR